MQAYAITIITIVMTKNRERLKQFRVNLDLDPGRQDKGDLVLLDKGDYVDKVNQILAGANTFQHIPTDKI